MTLNLFDIWFTYYTIESLLFSRGNKMSVLQWILTIIILLSLPFVGPILAIMAFYAESGSYTMNYIGRVLLGTYSLIYLISLYFVFRAAVLYIVRTHRNM